MTRPVRVLPAAVLVFALASVLWFGLGFAITEQLIADGSMRDRIHVVLGYASATVAAATVAGWLWALFASARAGSPVNGPVQVMCGATAVAQLAAALAMAALMGGHLRDEPTGLHLGHAGIAALLMLLVRRSRMRTLADGG